ncbi:MAG: TIR domain-containing protein [Clostridia bacterium]|nr:TIR domain-containing protein [Clostridia bacterium]
MKAYIIHKSDDRPTVIQCVQEIQAKCDKLEALILESVPQKVWKKQAGKKIAEADCAIFFVGAEAHKSEFIDWEIKQFIKKNKRIYTIKLADGNEYNKSLYRSNGFGNMENIAKSRYMYSKEVSIPELCDIIRNDLEMDITEAVKGRVSMSPDVMIEQYKAYLQTSEDLVARRQSVSNFYITVNSALISVLSAIIAVINIVGAQYAMLISTVGCYVISFLGIVLCLNWKRIVASYGQLNAAKMKVIAAIEKQLPFDIYDVEWKVQTDKLGKRKYVSFTNIEKRIPVIFAVLYGVLFIAGIVLTCVML